jgi:hypothetical protein
MHRPANNKDDSTRLVYWFDIFGWYWLVFSRYLPYQYQRKSWLVHFGMKILAGAHFSLQKGGLWTPFVALSPPFEGKWVPVDFFKKRVPRLQKRVPTKSYCTKNTNRIYQPTSVSTILIPTRQPVLGW